MIISAALKDDLTNGFIRYQYNLDYPSPAPYTTFDDMSVKYRHDAIFSNKVDSMVAGVLTILNKHVE